MKTGRSSIFERDKGDEWDRGGGYEHDEDGFSDQATQGTEVDDRDTLKSPVEDEGMDRIPSPRASMAAAAGLSRTAASLAGSVLSDI